MLCECISRHVADPVRYLCITLPEACLADYLTPRALSGLFVFQMATGLVPQTERVTAAQGQAPGPTGRPGRGRRRARGGSRPESVQRLADAMIAELTDSQANLSAAAERQIAVRIAEVRELLQSAARAQGNAS